MCTPVQTVNWSELVVTNPSNNEAQCEELSAAHDHSSK
jgi:hypothetical protein